MSDISKSTNVVNVKVKYINPPYKNLQEWMQDENNLYIGRRGVVFIPDGDGGKTRFPPQESKWCNPFKINEKNTREDVINKYRKYILEKMTDKDFDELRGKTLGCWCKPEACHGDVLVEILNQKI